MVTPPEDVALLQREVQRLLGRCLLRLQQYEGLLKSLLAHHEVSGPPAEMQTRQAERVSALAKTSLGNLAKTLFESYVVSRAEDGASPIDDRIDGAETSEITIRTRMTLEMAPEDFARTKNAIKELVDLRNALVHHFVESFNVWTVDGCVRAMEHLNDSYGRIDAHLEQLRRWAESMDDARALQASFLQSPKFQDFLVNGIAADGVVDWSRAGVVACLREAATHLDVGGWTQLHGAVVYIVSKYPEQTPEKYACRSWPQVLNEARVFETKYRHGPGRKRTAVYRERLSR